MLFSPGRLYLSTVDSVDPRLVFDGQEYFPVPTDLYLASTDVLAKVYS
jgi:hypothetical protein